MRWSTLGTEYQQLESRQTHPRLRLFMLSQCQRRSSHCNLSLASYVRMIYFHLVYHCKFSFQLTKKEATFHWDQSCQQHLDEVKRFLLDAHALAIPHFFTVQMLLRLSVLAQTHPYGTTQTLPMLASLCIFRRKIMASQNQ